MKQVYYVFFGLVLLGCTPTTKPTVDGSAVDTLLIAAHIRELASDAYLGRKPFTEGEAKTVAYIRAQFEKMGLEPGNGDSYFQEVPMVEITGVPSREMMVEGNGSQTALNVSTDFVAYTERVSEEVSLDQSELVYAGYGIVAPEYDWNDYEGMDVKGKTVIVLVNDPGFEGDDTTFFKGKTMTYYGRWTYKYEEAARQGAAGVIIVHETVPAGYPWMVVTNSWSGARLGLDRSGDDTYQCAVVGWMTRDAAIRVFEQSAVDMKNFKEKARSRDFEAVSLGLTASVSIKNTIRKDLSRNVVAKITGTAHPDEAIIYSAHWDHLGVGNAIDGDSIYNGAHDNASGTALLLGLAEAFARGEKPRRTVVFLSVTAEEQGLLGSQYYAENPLFEPRKTVANLNMDGVSSFGRMKDLTVIGYGQSEMDDMGKVYANKQGRYIKSDPDPGKGYFFRSDHFNFAKIGIPALYASGSYEAETGGVERIQAETEDYLMNRYHKPADEFSEAHWQFGGILQDGELYYQVGQELANSDRWPKWKEGSEFKSIRDKE
ncbi:MAG: M28 family metallopeptidase [Cyclobacteriaceae bacterium]|nr:M28 family metallopeptidase [Cyclobacteriaceae bacterium]